LLQRNRKNTNSVAENRILPNLKELIQMISTFLLVVFGWIFFRAETIGKALDYIARLFEKSLFTIPKVEGANGFYLCLLSIILTEWVQRSKKYGLQIDMISSQAIRWLIYLSIVVLILFFGGKSETFIYFQF